MCYLDTDSLRKLTTTAHPFYEAWLIPALWRSIDSEEDYFDSRVGDILEKNLHKVVFFKAQYKHEFGLNTPLNDMLFNMYNVVKLNLTGCTLVHNMDFLQIMYKLQVLNVSVCPNMSTSSLIHSMPTLGTLCQFICRGNDVRM